MIPDGAAWWFARILAGMTNGVERPHGHLDLWVWDATRLTLNYALHGLVARPARRSPP